MSNTSKGLAEKGSKFWMQAIVNSKMIDQLNAEIGVPLDWLSPLKGEKEEYLEYELKQDYICNAIGLTENEKKSVFSFWPNRQPQWDGIALSKDKTILYLVEAKAHLTELNSKLMASSAQSKELIINSMREVFDSRYSTGTFSLWVNQYYQLANRLTFLHKLGENLNQKKIEVKLILLNFVDDYTYKPTSADEWNKHYDEVFLQMTGYKNPPQNVSVINLSVVGRGCARNPMSGELIFHEKKILSYGFSSKENNRIKDNLPSSCSLLVCDNFSDLIAYNGNYFFVNPVALSNEQLHTLMDFYSQEYISKELSV